MLCVFRIKIIRDFLIRSDTVVPGPGLAPKTAVSPKDSYFKVLKRFAQVITRPGAFADHTILFTENRGLIHLCHDYISWFGQMRSAASSMK